MAGTTFFTKPHRPITTVSAEQSASTSRMTLRAPSTSTHPTFLTTRPSITSTEPAIFALRTATETSGGCTRTGSGILAASLSMVSTRVRGTTSVDRRASSVPPQAMLCASTGATVSSRSQVARSSGFPDAVCSGCRVSSKAFGAASDSSTVQRVCRSSPLPAVVRSRAPNRSMGATLQPTVRGVLSSAATSKRRGSRPEE